MEVPINKYIDHTLLKPSATSEQVKALCEEALKYNFKSVCVNPCFVALAHELLANSDVLVCTVIGFPLGSNTSEIKALEAQDAIANGADELDMVINVGALKSGDTDYVQTEIAGLARIAHASARVLKVIIETCLLNDEEKVIACNLSKEAGADFVKTSTGFSTGGATVDDIRLMREAVGPYMGVKASGGIRSADDAKAMIEAGASRLGASAGIAIVEGF